MKSFFIVAAICSCLLLSCSESTVDAPIGVQYDGEPTQLYGAIWYLEVLNYKGVNFSPRILSNSTKEYSVLFTSDTILCTPSVTQFSGSVIGKADCNTFTANFTANKQNSLRIQNINVSNNPCDTVSKIFANAMPFAVEYSMITQNLLKVSFLNGGYATFSRVLNPKAVALQNVVPTDFTTYTFPKSDMFDLQTITINNDTLRMDVRYGGGCEQHDFTLAIDNSFKNTSAISTYIVHNANGDSCKAVIHKTLFFTLGSLRKEYERVTGKTSGELKLRFTAGSENVLISYTL